MKVNYIATIYVEADSIEEVKEIFDNCNQDKISIDCIEVLSKGDDDEKMQRLKEEIRKDSENINNAEMVSVNCVFTQIDKIFGEKLSKGDEE